MAKVERIWFRQRFGAQELEPMYDPALAWMPTTMTWTRRGGGGLQPAAG